jgi:hypothetical protein
MTPDVDQTCVLPFADGDAVCPRWWGTLAPFRLGPEHGNQKPRLKMTRAEAAGIVNHTLEADFVNKAVRDLMALHPIRLRS